MAEKLSVGALEPGDVVTLSHIGELPAFEDLVAEHIDTQMAELDIEGFYHEPLDLATWAARTSIKEMLRVPKFNGNVLNIRLVRLDDPYEHRLTVKERGKNYAKNRHANPVNGPFAELQRPLYQGFQFVGDASSSNGWKGQVQSELYYYPIPINKIDEHSPLKRYIESNWFQHTSAYAGLNVVRSITKPVIVEDEAYLIRHEASTETGFKVLQRAMRRPISTPMRD